MAKKVILPITEHPNYGEIVKLWIYSPVQKKWINMIGEGWVSIPFNVDHSLFMTQLRWLNVGAFFFPSDIDPNEQNPISPIILFEDFLQSHGIVQEFLDQDGRMNLDRAMIRDFGMHHKIDALQQQYQQIQQEKQASKSPVDLAVAKLKEGFQPKQNFTQRVLSKVESSGYTLEVSEDGSQIRIKLE